MQDRPPSARGTGGGQAPGTGVLFVVAVYVLAGFAFGAYALAAYVAEPRDLGWFYGLRDGRVVVEDVSEGGPADGAIRPGDLVGGANESAGDPASIDAELRAVAPGAPYVLRVERDGATAAVTMRAPERAPWSRIAADLASYGVSLAFLALGLQLALLRQGDRVARLGAAAFLLSALGLMTNALTPLAHLFHGPELVANFLANAPTLLMFAVVFHFYSVFPSEAVRTRGWARAVTGVYVAGAVAQGPHWLLLVVLTSPWLQIARLLSGRIEVFYALLVVVQGYMTAALGLTAAVTVRNFARTREEGLRRRIRWAAIGTAVGIGPTVALQAVSFVAFGFGAPSPALSKALFALIQLANLFLLCIPLSFGYAIFKHRLFDVRVVVRRGMQYLLARGVLETVLALPFVWLVVTVARRPELTVGELVSQTSIYLYLLIAGALSIKFRARLGEWLDRRFFRDAYDRERILMRLIDDIKQHESPAEIARMVSIELEVAMHPSRVVIAARDDHSGELTVQFSSGDHTGDFRVPGDSELVRALEAGGRAADVSGLGVPEGEAAALREIGVSLAVPVTSPRGRLLGLLLLGEKRSEEPYGSRDRRLLESIAAQMAVAFENAQLKDRVARDQRIKVEVLGRVGGGGVNLLKECPRCGLCFDSQTQFCHADGSELTHTLPVERVVEGKYRLERLIGRGGMGAVYEALDLRLDRRVAVKVMVGSMFGDRAAMRRFEREARASARLNHPNIVTVFDFGATGVDGAFLVMECLRGTTMREALMRAGAMPPTTAARWLDGILEAVYVAHAAGVVHRDLKPENVLLADMPDGSGVVKVLDFGLAKIHRPGALPDDDSGSLTAPGTVMGTFGYMSPEQLAGAEVDERTDIYAIGVMTVEALTGSRPYGGRGWGELITAMTRGDYRLPGDSPEQRHLDGILRRCLAPAAKDRHASVAELRGELLAAVVRYVPPDAAPSGDSEPTRLYGEAQGA